MIKTCILRLFTPEKCWDNCDISYEVSPVGGDRLYRIARAVVARTAQIIPLEWLEKTYAPDEMDEWIAAAVHGAWAKKELGITLGPKKRPARKKPLSRSVEDEGDMLPNL